MKSIDHFECRILFVCMGNICRSPMAEGTFRRMLEGMGLLDRVQVDSAGTHSYHVGAPPDKRGQQTARRRGVNLKDIRARQVETDDFQSFDYLIAMDETNYQYLMELCPDPKLRNKVQRFMDYAADLPDKEVPDPYYGGLGGFERVMDLIEAASEGLLAHICQQQRA